MKLGSKRNTIFRQLVLSVLLPVVVLIAVLSIYNFLEQKEQLISNRNEAIDQLQSEIIEFLEFYDITILELEKGMSNEAEIYSEELVNTYFQETDQITTCDLDSIRQLAEMPAHYDIYIIDTNGIVVNTTYPPDEGLDFFSLGEYFVNHLNAVWASQEFMEDRISIEQSTGLPKKYTYQSTLDTNYVIELGIYNQPAMKLVDYMIDRLDQMPEKYAEIDSVILYFGTSYFLNYQDRPISEDLLGSAMHTLETHESTEYIREKNGVNQTTEFHFLKMESAYLHDGYVLRVQHNDSKLEALMWSQFKSFLMNLLLFTLPIFILILWRAKKLSSPISNLVTKIDLIRTKKTLSERVPISGNNEVTELGEHFNSMVAELQESYETLEQKVAERTQEVVAQKEVIEEVYHEIQDSIQYAKRLQLALLPKLDDIATSFPNYSVLFMPKDVVSGDFYWFEKKGNIAFIAAADCTGHGVPGALVSVVCSSALNRAVNEYDLTSPAEILDKARTLVIASFAKSGESVKDGMDISLCAIHLEENKLNFSGANNPLWLIRSNSNLSTEQLEEKSTYQGENTSLVEFKSDRQPVGLYAEMRPFTEKEIKLEKGDTIYLHTDGYADQFGGKRGKKLKSRTFKRMLLKMNETTIHDHSHQLKEEFNEWKGIHEQIDDVCVLGIRF